MRCEDFPCCGHALGDCPDSQGRMRCVECGKRLSKRATSSICHRCLRRMEQDEDYERDHPPDEQYDYYPGGEYAS